MPGPTFPNQTIAERVDAYLARLNEMDAEKHAEGILGPRYATYSLGNPGPKYVRIVRETTGGGRSVHVFIERATGDVYKAEGWKAPAKGVRYQIADDDSYARLLKEADPVGGQFYVR